MSVLPVLCTLALLPMPREFTPGDGFCGDPAKIEYTVDRSLPAEGYTLNVTKEGVRITSATPAGHFYAERTLDDLKADGRLPICRIKDAPAYRWRGLHLDESRHFFGKQVVKRFIDRMAALKFNVFHWHLTDHQGWRLQIDACPELTEKGSIRNVPEWKRMRPREWLDVDAAAYGPYFYTKDDVREILSYAHARHITVMPEIEIPGHSLAAIRACPFLLCPDSRDKLDKLGYRCATICAGSDEVLRFYEKVLDEVCALFPSVYIHTGGDEARKDIWRECPRCQARIKKEGLKDETELQAWLTRHFADYLAAKGRRLVGWDEILEGDALAAGAVVMSWRGRKGAIAAAMAGHDVILCPEQYCYYDFRQGLANDPETYHGKSRQFAPVSAAMVYSFDPCEGIPSDRRGHVIGAQGNSWTELTLDEKTLDWKLWTRAAALAEVLWTSPEKRDFSAFAPRLEAFRAKLKAKGVNVAPFADPSAMPSVF